VDVKCMDLYEVHTVLIRNKPVPKLHEGGGGFMGLPFQRREGELRIKREERPNPRERRGNEKENWPC